MDHEGILTVGIFIFDEVEVLDFCGPLEVFASAISLAGMGDVHQLFQVVVIAEEDKIITCSGGLLVKPHATIKDHPPLDILVVPGGDVWTHELSNSQVLEWIRQQDQHTRLTTSVCTGAYLLAECGLLDQRRATTHWSGIEGMRQRYPAVEILADTRIVDEGHIITSAGVSAGIDMSLHVVSRLYGEQVAKQTARYMEYEGSTPGKH